MELLRIADVVIVTGLTAGYSSEGNNENNSVILCAVIEVIMCTGCYECGYMCPLLLRD